MSRLPQGKIRTLRIEGFRGALRSVELDFGDACTSMVIYGENGTGKSTFADGVEWFLTGRIEHLAREGCQDHAYRHRRLPETQSASVALVFDDPAYCGTRTIDGERLADLQCPESVGAFVNGAGRDTVILRHAQMRDFVDKTKTEKLKYVSEILGLGRLSQQRDQLASVSGRLRNDPTYKTLASDVKRCQKQLATLVGAKRFDLQQVYRFCEGLRQTLGGHLAVTDAASLRDCTAALLKLRSQDDRAKAARQVREQRKQLTVPDAVISICDEMDRLGQDCAALQADKRAVDELALAELYKAGQDVLARKLGDPEHCPLCGQGIDRDHLHESLAAQLEGIAAVQNRLLQLSMRRQSLRDHLDQWQVWAARVSATTWDECVSSPDALRQAATSVAALATKWGKEIAVADDPMSPIPGVFPEQRALVESLLEQCAVADESLADRLVKLEESAEEKERNSQLETLQQIGNLIQSLDQAQRESEAFDRQLAAMDAVTQRFEVMERETLAQVLEAISDDVNRYYLHLHPGEGFDHVRLTPTANRGLEFEFMYHGELISPPGQLLSESHLNTLGICLFLAAARHFNRSLRFLILDDIVNSVDAAHRQMMARLLRDEFADTQIILLTHDEIWFDIVKHHTRGDWRATRIAGWDYAEGFWIDNELPDWDAEARHLLSLGQIDSAGNKARKWFEQRLKRLCHELGVELPFMFNNKNERRAVSELLPKLKAYLRNSQTFAANKMIFNDLEANQFVANLLSHDSPVVSAPPKANDVQLLLDDLARLEALVTCPSCDKVMKRGAACRCTPPFSWK